MNIKNLKPAIFHPFQVFSPDDPTQPIGTLKTRDQVIIIAFTLLLLPTLFGALLWLFLASAYARSKYKEGLLPADSEGMSAEQNTWMEERCVEIQQTLVKFIIAAESKGPQECEIEIDIDKVKEPGFLEDGMTIEEFLHNLSQKVVQAEVQIDGETHPLHWYLIIESVPGITDRLRFKFIPAGPAKTWIDTECSRIQVILQKWAEVFQNGEPLTAEDGTIARSVADALYQYRGYSDVGFEVGVVRRTLRVSVDISQLSSDADEDSVSQLAEKMLNHDLLRSHFNVKVEMGAKKALMIFFVAGEPYEGDIPEISQELRSFLLRVYDFTPHLTNRVVADAERLKERYEQYELDLKNLLDGNEPPSDQWTKKKDFYVLRPEELSDDMEEREEQLTLFQHYFLQNDQLSPLVICEVKANDGEIRFTPVVETKPTFG